MKYKSIKTLVLIFVALVIITGIYYLLQQRKNIPAKPFAQKEITKVEIQTDALCKFEKSDGKWKLVAPVEYALDTVQFSRLLEGIKALEIGEVVTSRPERYAECEVGDNGTQITVWTGNNSLSLIVGKQAPDFINSYLRFPGKKEVYLAKGLVKWIVNKKADEWRDAFIFAFDPAKLKKIILKDKEIVKGDTCWTYKNKPVDKNRMNTAINAFSNFRADGFSKEGFVSDSAFIIKLVLDDGDKTLNIGKKIDDKYQLQVDTNPTVFLISVFKIEKLNEVINPPKPEPKKPAPAQKVKPKPAKTPKPEIK